jgi:uncharacterized protein YndB with AHSA1/START domain
MKLDPDIDLTFTRVLKAPRRLIWECWTTPRHIREFFVPKPHGVTACEIDLRPGGRFDTTFLVDGTAMENRGVVLEVVEGEKLVFTDAYSEGWKPAPDPFMTAIVILADAAGGGTSYTVIVRHRSAEVRKTHEEMGFLDGWGTVADQLDAYALSLSS